MTNPIVPLLALVWLTFTLAPPQAGGRTTLPEPLEGLVSSRVSGASGLAGFTELSRMATAAAENRPAGDPEIDRAMNGVSDAVRRDVTRRLRAGAERLLAPLVETHRTGLRTLGTGLDALEAGTRWYHELIAQFGSFEASPPVKGAISALWARRNLDLLDGRDALGERLRAASAGERPRLLDRYLGVPGDRTHSAAGGLLTALDNRTPTPSDARDTAPSRPAAPAAPPPAPPSPRSEAESFCDRQPDAADPDGGPSARQMCLAVAADVDAINRRFREQESMCRSRGYEGNPIAALQCLQLCGGTGGTCRMSVELTRFDKVACADARPTGQAGYICDYVLNFSASSPAVRDAMASLGGGASLVQGRFVRLPDGWSRLPVRQNRHRDEERFARR